MIVCHCRGITDRDVKRAIRAGAGNLHEVAHHCGAATGCGGCAGSVLEILNAESANCASFEGVLHLAPAG